MKIKFYFLMFLAIPLAGCVEPAQPDQAVRQKLFMQCLDLAAKARKGVNYTTNDDEDYDSVIQACGNQAFYMSLKI